MNKLLFITSLTFLFLVSCENILTTTENEELTTSNRMVYVPEELSDVYPYTISR